MSDGCLKKGSFDQCYNLLVDHSLQTKQTWFLVGGVVAAIASTIAVLSSMLLVEPKWKRMPLDDSSSGYFIICDRSEYMLAYRPNVQSPKPMMPEIRAFIGFSPIDLAPLCNHEVTIKAKYRAFFGKPICQPEALAHCEKGRAVVVDISSIDY